jgi:tetracycline resistance efflux pump
MGWLSVVPPVVAITMAIISSNVYFSLLVFIFLGWTLVAGGNPVQGAVDTVDGIVAVFADTGNTQIVIFQLLIGGVVALVQYSGGVQGFIDFLNRDGEMPTRRKAALATVLAGMPLYIETNINLLVRGFVMRPVFDALRVSREKLAYLLDSTASPMAALIPFNAWGAYVLALLVAFEVDEPVQVLASAIPFNFYAICAVLLATYVAFSNRDFGPMKRAESRVREGGETMSEGSHPLVSDGVLLIAPKEGVVPRAHNLFVPVAVMIISMISVLYVTGDGNPMSGSGSTAVLWAAVLSVVVAMAMYRAQGLLSFGEMSDHVLQGFAGFIPVVVLLVLAFAISGTVQALGTGDYLAELARSSVSPVLVPGVIFFTACFTSFSTGSSWGTWAIMIPIALPIAAATGLDVGLILGAVMGGGIFGDHCSPISDTTIVASLAGGTSHRDHVRTQLPYATIAAAGALILYTVAAVIL